MVAINTGRQILDMIARRGYRAYIVGGAPRDVVLGREPHDIDIVTDAPAAEIERLAAENGWRAVGVGAAFGITALIIDGRKYDIATVQPAKSGGHAPDWLVDDLSRRDFTINALAIAGDGTLLDPFGGVADIGRKCLRAVGSPADRYREDALRMFRAARFAAQHGFAVEQSTRQAIGEHRERIRTVSIERICGELEKILLAPHAGQGLRLLVGSGLLSQQCRARDNKTDADTPILPELVRLGGLLQNPRYHEYDVLDHTLAAVSLSAPTPVLRWAALLHDIAKGLPAVRGTNKQGQPCDYGHEQAGAELAAEILRRLRLPSAAGRRIVWLIAHHTDLPAPDKAAVLKWLRRLAGDFKASGELREAAGQLLGLHRADQLAGHVGVDREALATREAITGELLAAVPFYPAQLKISGRAIAQALGEGPVVAAFQRDLLARIQAGRLANDAAKLEEALAAKVRRLAGKAAE